MKRCVESEVVFDTTTLEKIVEDPEWVLTHENAFWEQYRAQVLTRKWADHVNYDIQYEDWREKVQAWADLTQEERDGHVLMKITGRILSAKDEFLEKALPHDCAFLPAGVDLSVTVQFTAFVPPFAFAMEDLVIDVASEYWKGNPEHVLNLLVHEIFHVGYSHYRTMQTEKGMVDDRLYGILDNIVNEGICTYVGYRALPIFPVEDERDYRMMEDKEVVHRLFADTNEVLSQFAKLSEEELGKLSWEKGVIGRAYYVTGAQMCREIDETTGRESLINVYTKGPLSIIQLYNSIAHQDLKVVLPA